MTNALRKGDREFYGEYLQDLLAAEKGVVAMVTRGDRGSVGKSCIEYCVSRIKTAKSMQKKLLQNNLPVTLKAALTELTDTVGVRIICHFTDDIFTIAKRLQNQPNLRIVQIKDYISCPKPNGYRSYHMITQLQIENQNWVFVEIQIRTIAQDSWASLEHKIKYKKKVKDQKLIQQELKRCADEMASTDISMQTIRELICETAEKA